MAPLFSKISAPSPFVSPVRVQCEPVAPAASVFVALTKILPSFTSVSWLTPATALSVSLIVQVALDVAWFTPGGMMIVSTPASWL